MRDVGTIVRHVIRMDADRRSKAWPACDRGDGQPNASEKNLSTRTPAGGYESAKHDLRAAGMLSGHRQ